MMKKILISAVALTAFGATSTMAATTPAPKAAAHATKGKKAKKVETTTSAAPTTK